MLKMKLIDLQRLQEELIPIETNNESIEGIMRLLGLTCERTHMTSSLYTVQCMLRLYRKMWKTGLKYLDAHEWESILLSGKYDDLRKMNFFPEIVSKQVMSKCRSALVLFCQENGYELHTKQMGVEIDTPHATWKFDLRNKGADLRYVPKRYTRVPRYDMRIEDKSEDMMTTFQEILGRITSTEERLRYGVGNAVIEKLVVELGVTFPGVRDTVCYANQQERG